MHHGLRLAPVLASFLLVFMVSGCIGQQSVPTGSGVAILDFGPEIDSVYSGESVNFHLRVKNTGSFEPTGLKARIDLSEWTGDCTTRKESGTFSLIAPDPERGTGGEETVISWKCTAPPNIDEGMHIPYEARAEVEYGYRTVSSKSVTLLPTYELVALKNAGRPLPSETMSHSSSPVNVDIQVKAPVRIMEGSGNVEFPVTIKITNVGGGIVKGSKIDEITVEGSGLSTGSCVQGELALWKGQSQTVTCKMSASNVEVMTQARIVVTLKYDYLISSAASIEVVGTANQF